MEIERDASLRGWELLDYTEEDIYLHDMDKDGLVVPPKAYSKKIIIVTVIDNGKRNTKVIIKDTLLVDITGRM